MFINRNRDRGIGGLTWHQYLLIEVTTVDLAPMLINNRGCDHCVGGSTWCQHLFIEVTIVALVGQLGANIKLHHGDS